MIEIEDIIGCFDMVNEKCLFQNVLIERLRDNDFNEIEINAAVNEALASGVLKRNSSEQICIN